MSDQFSEIFGINSFQSHFASKTPKGLDHPVGLAMQKLMNLVDALEDDEDVQRVTTNFEASDEVKAQLDAG